MFTSFATIGRMARERILSGEAQGEEENHFNYALRPQRFEQYIGQPTLIRKLGIAVKAAQGRKEPVEHTLLHGPPGLGKTTLAHVIANEMKAQVYVSNGPAMSKPADLVGILTKLQQGDVLFIDEIHRLPAAVEEYLYSAMEDFKVDVTIDAGMHARTITMPLPPFTLIGSTASGATAAGISSSTAPASSRRAATTSRATTGVTISRTPFLPMSPEPAALSTCASSTRSMPTSITDPSRPRSGAAAK